MSALVIDTTSWISYFRGSDGGAVVESALEEGRVHLSPVVAAELLSGKMTDRERGALESLLADLPLCGVDLGHWFRVGRLRASLRAKGVAISTPDAHVAQCALDLAADLLTEDGIFEHVVRHSSLRLLPR